MKRILLTSSLLLLAGSGFAAHNQPPAGFTALFNGKDLSGWYGWGTKDPTELWKMTPEQSARNTRRNPSRAGCGREGQDSGPSTSTPTGRWRTANSSMTARASISPPTRTTATLNCCVEYKALPDGDSGVYLRGIPQVQIWDYDQGRPARTRPGQGIRRALEQQQGSARQGSVARKWTSLSANGTPSRSG